MHTTHNNDIIFMPYFIWLVLFKLPHHAVLRQNFKFLKAHEAEGLLAICIFLIKVSGTGTVKDRHVSLRTCFLCTGLLTYLCNVQSNGCQKFTVENTQKWENKIQVFEVFVNVRRLDQGAKKVSFTACHSGKLLLACTGPKVISTSPQTIFY